MCARGASDQPGDQNIEVLIHFAIDFHLILSLVDSLYTRLNRMYVHKLHSEDFNGSIGLDYNL